jgi:hypothetical protein
MTKDYLCACGKKKYWCKGTCRAEHLHRERQAFKLCPAAYKEKR